MPVQRSICNSLQGSFLFVFPLLKANDYDLIEKLTKPYGPFQAESSNKWLQNCTSASKTLFPAFTVTFRGSKTRTHIEREMR